MPRFSRRAAPERMCSSRQRKRSEWYSRSSRSSSRSRPGTRSSVSRWISSRAAVFSTTVSQTWLGDERRRCPIGVQLAELVAVAGQQRLRDELEQDRVVALEGREDLGVGLELAEAVLGQVAGAAAGLAAALDRLGRVPGGERLEAGGARLELAAGPLLLVATARRCRRRRRRSGRARRRRPPG